jgi:predicted nucleic acid-binding protein
MKMIQVRNVPDELHRALKARAAMEGRTLSDYILAELPRPADKPYDAAYVALAEELSDEGVPLLTTDGRLARAVRARSAVEVLST